MPSPPHRCTPLTDFPGPNFGIPEPTDPDPYGVKALEAEGLLIREAGTHQRPSAEAFEFKPSPASPIYGHFSRKSVDSTFAKSKRWRESTSSLASIDRGTQTNLDESPPRRGSGQISPPRKESQNVTDSDHQAHSPERRGSFSDIDSDVEIHTATPVVSKARVVSVPKRVPPALPPRNPGRTMSPLADSQPPTEGFEQISLNGGADDRKESAVSSSNEMSGLDLNDSRLSRATSEGGDDKFESIPGSPVDEKDDGKAKAMQ